MNICDLSNEDIVRIVTDIFSPSRIVNIKRHKRDDYYISCDIYTEWSSKDGNDKEEIKDEIELRDPFKHGLNAIRSAWMPARRSGRGRGYIKLMQFCFAKGMKPDWMENNLYISPIHALQDIEIDGIYDMSIVNSTTGEKVMSMPLHTDCDA